MCVRAAGYGDITARISMTRLVVARGVSRLYQWRPPEVTRARQSMAAFLWETDVC